MNHLWRLVGSAFILVVVMHCTLLHAEQQSRFGKDDLIGAANYLSVEKTLQAASLIKRGKVYSLGIPVSRDTPAVAPRSMSINILMPYQYEGMTIGNNEASYLDDTISGWMGIGTQIDSLAHAGKGGVFYNGNHARDFVTPTGVKKLGVEGIPPIVTRGVLLDVARYKGVARLEAGYVITSEDLEKTAKSQGIEIKEGDVAIIHTGWLSMMDEDPEAFKNGEPGLNSDSAMHLVSKNVVAVGADNWGIDAFPFKNQDFFNVHLTLLYENGTYILEMLDTRELAEDKVYEFMFVLGQPKYSGAIQTIINPIAIR